MRFIQNYQSGTCLLDPTKTDIILQEYISNLKGVGELANYSLDKLKEYCREKHIKGYSSFNKDALIDFIVDYQEKFINVYKLCESSGIPSPPEESKAPGKAKLVKPILAELKTPIAGEPFEVSPKAKLDKYGVRKLLAYCKDLQIECSKTPKCPKLKKDIIKSIISKEKSILEKYKSPSPSPSQSPSPSDVDMG